MLGIALVAALGVRLFYSVPPALTLGPLAGLAAAATTRRRLDAALVAAMGLLGGVAAARLVSQFTLTLATFAEAAAGAAVAAAVAVVALRMTDRRPGDGRVLAAGVAVLLVAMWTGGLVGACVPAPGSPSLVSLLSHSQPLGRGSNDDQVYLAYMDRIRAGRGYYDAAVEVLRRGNAVRGLVVDAASPRSYRLPTLYWSLARLPDDGVSIVVVFLALGSIAVVGVYLMVRRGLSPPLALAACAAVAALVAGYAGELRILDAESWAGLLGVAAVSLAIVAAEGERLRRPLYLGAVGLALAAALVRELAFPFLLLGLLSAVLDPALRRTRMWLAWVAATLGAVFGYAAHVRSASLAVASARVPPGPPYSALHPFGTGLKGAAFLAGDITGWRPLPMAALLCLGLLGAALAGRRRISTAVLLAGTAFGGALALSFLGAPGPLDVHGVPPSYWAAIVLPAVVACAPVALAAVERLGRCVALRPPTAPPTEPPPPHTACVTGQERIEHA